MTALDHMYELGPLRIRLLPALREAAGTASRPSVLPQRSGSRQGESPYWDGVGGMWRIRRAIGSVKVTSTGKEVVGLVLRLSRAMHRHLTG